MPSPEDVGPHLPEAADILLAPSTRAQGLGGVLEDQIMNDPA